MKLILHIVLLFFSCLVFGQKASVSKANKLFKNRAYVEAAQMYLELEPNQENLQNLADCYFYTNNMQMAVRKYTQLFGSYKAQVDKAYYFRFGHALKAIYNYSKADEILSEYYGYKVDTQKFIENTKETTKYIYETKRLTISNSSEDFGMSFYGDKVVFASTRSEHQPKYKWNEKPYLDLFMADINEAGNLENIVPFPDEINTATHEASAIFTKDLKTMYFCRTGDVQVKVGGEEFASVKLYKAEFVDEKWTNVTELPFNSDQYSIQNPALNAKEDKLFFASDMPGTLGSMDIFYVNINPDGTYSEPINLGNTINTPHREQFPFLSQNDELYFSSDGHEGFGNLDLFVSSLKDGKYDYPINLGESINSGFDDFCFTLDAEGTKGFFSSNRENTDNLYGFNRNYVSQKFTIEGDVKDFHSGELLPGTTITLYDENQRMVAQVVADGNARYLFPTQPNTKYRIEAVKDLYIPFIEEVMTNDEGHVMRNIGLLLSTYESAEDIISKKDDGLTYIHLENIYFELNKWNVLPESKQTLNVLVNLMKKYPKVEIELRAHTDTQASDTYNLRLSIKRAQAVAQYLMSQGIQEKRVKWKGYGESKPLIRCGDNCTEEQHAINRRCEFVILR